MSFANSFCETTLRDLLLDQRIPSNIEDSISSCSYNFPLDYTSQHQEFPTTVAFAPSDYSQGNISWGLQQYINSSNVPWTDKILVASCIQNDSFEVTPAQTQSPNVPKKEPLSLPINSEEHSIMSYHRGSLTAISYGLPAPGDMGYAMVPGVRQAPSGEGRNYHPRSSGSDYIYPKGGNDTGKSSGASKFKKSYGRDDGEEDEDADHPHYIPSSSSRAKSRASGSADYACWFFKLDPVKYADCMHVRGRSSDLKYAHLKHHFKNGAIPSGFDKNMSWDEVWNTLFPRIPPPNNKYYVINEMIMSVLESASVEGDDVTRFLDTLTQQESREAAINRIYSHSQDRGGSPGSGPSSSTRRNRQGLQLPPFDRIPRTTGHGFTPSSSSGSSSNNTPATSSRPSRGYSSAYGSYHGGLDLGLEGTHLGTDAYTFFGAGGTTSPTSPEYGKVTILDEHGQLLWFEPDVFDFTTFYLTHSCSKPGHQGEIRIESIEDLQNEYTWHETGQVGGDCPFLLISQRY